MEIFQELFNSIKNFPSESSYFYTYPTYTIQKNVYLSPQNLYEHQRDSFVLLRNNLVDYLEKKAYNNLWLSSTKKKCRLKIGARGASSNLPHPLYL